MEKFLAHTYHHWIYILVIITLASMAWIAMFRRGDFRDIKKSHWEWLMVIMILGILFRWGFSPMKPQVFHDEFYYLSAGENTAVNNVITPLILRGYPPGDGRTYHFNPPYPHAWPGVLSIIFRVVRRCSFAVASRFSFVLSCLVPLWIFFAGCFLMQDLGPNPSARRYSGPKCGLAGALCWACLPVLIKFTGSAAMEPASAFFISLFLGALFLYHRHPSKPAFLLMASTGGLMINSRPENLFYLLIAGVFLVPKIKKIPRDVLWTGGFILGLSLAGAFLIMASGLPDPERAHVFTIIPREAFPGPVQNALANLWNNLLFLLGFWGIHPVVLTLAGAFGLYRMILAGDCPPRGYLMGIWGLVIYLILSMFPFGDFAGQNSYDASRFSIHLYFPLIFTASYGFHRFISLFAGTALRRLALTLTVLIILFSPFRALDYLGTRHPHQNFYQATRQLSKMLPGDALVMAESPEAALMLRFALDKPAFLIKTADDVNSLDPGECGLFLFSTESPSEMILENFRLEPFSSFGSGTGGYTVFRMEKLE